MPPTPTLPPDSIFVDPDDAIADTGVDSAEDVARHESATDGFSNLDEFLAWANATRERSVAEELAHLPAKEQEELLDGVDPDSLLYSWDTWARPSQVLPESGFNTAVVMAGRGWGKGLPLDTPIPTPNGFTRMGDLQDGDEVYYEAGKTCHVVAAHDPYTPNHMFRLTFDDDSSILADADHLWRTQTRREYKRARGYNVRTTKELLDSLDDGHCVQVTAPLELPDAELPVDPYTLGAWLGDGASAGPTICGVDSEIFDRIRKTYALRDGRSPSSIARQPNLQSWFIGGRNELTPHFHTLQLFKNKHVPEPYFWGSVEQRLELLRGIMDTDGTIEKTGCRAGVGFVSRRLRDDVQRLLVTLGYKARARTRRKGVHGRPETIKDFYTVEFRPTPERNPFALTRKAERVVAYRAQSNRATHRRLVSVTEAPIVTVRCITVDSPDATYLAGRELITTHNTRVGSEWIRQKARDNPGCRIILLGRTTADVRDVMVLGESGILAVSPPGEKPEYLPSRRLLTWPNGSQALLATSQEPSVLRGPQAHFAWADEIGTYTHVPDESGLTAWQNLRIATRLGEAPQVITTTTPKRMPAVQELMDEVASANSSTIIIRGRTVDNVAALSRSYLEMLFHLYHGTALWAQEIMGEVVDAVEGALWSDSTINSARALTGLPSLPFRVVAVDPSVAENPRDECGIVVVGGTSEKLLHKRHAYVLEDATIHGAPGVWAAAVVEAHKKWKTAGVVAEGNQGGELVRMAIHAVDPTVPVFIVHARQNKQLRAEPVVTAYEQKRVHHVGYLGALETQMTGWEPGVSKKSPDRVDALVYGVAAVLIKPPKDLFKILRPLRAKSAGSNRVSGIKRSPFAGHRSGGTRAA